VEHNYKADEHSVSYHSVRLLCAETCRWNIETMGVSSGSGAAIQAEWKRSIPSDRYLDQANASNGRGARVDHQAALGVDLPFG